MSEFTTLPDAIARFVRPGHRVALEGFTHLIPFAAGHEIIRQGLTDLTLVRMTPDLLYDQMIGSGCARKLVFSWGGNPGVGSLHRLRDAVERGWPRPLEIEEHSHSAMAHAYAAGAAGMPSAFFRGYLGSDLAKVNPNIKFITCPFTGERAGVGARASARRHDRPRAEGRPRRQRAHRGHHRRAEGSRAGGADGDRHRRGDRRSLSRASARTRSSCRPGPSTPSSPCPAARIRPTRTATTRATTRSTSRGTPSRETATAFSGGSRST